MCKKQTSVSHSSTESEIIYFDAGLRLDGIPALDLWDLNVFVLGNTIQTPDRSGQPVVNCDKDHGSNKRFQGIINVLNSIDCFPVNVQFSHQEALLYVFEDNEAVINMNIKGRSPTMRHVSRTHRVALDWVIRSNQFGLQNPDQVHRHQQPTCRHATRDEWNLLLCLFNIRHFSFTVCSAAMAKRIQQESGEERGRSKIKTYDESNCEDAIGRVVFNFIKPGEDMVRISRSWEI